MKTSGYIISGDTVVVVSAELDVVDVVVVSLSASIDSDNEGLPTL